MNIRKLALIVLIYLVASGAWSYLGGTIVRRTADAREELSGDVARMFGPPIVQSAPTIRVEGGERGPDASDIRCRFEHEHRYRGLVWFSVFRVRFEALYRIDGKGARSARFHMALPADANLDSVEASVGGRRLAVDRSGIVCDVPFPRDEPVSVRVRYTTAGQDRWTYDPGGRGLRDFRLEARTDFTEIDYPSWGLSPTSRARSDGEGGMVALWEFTRMLPAHNGEIGVVMPSRPASGPLAARLSSFAPVSFFFFLVVMVTIQILRRLRLHPMNYLLLAAGFFSFHILLAYLVDHLPIHVAFWLAAAASVFLVTSYLRLVVGIRTALGVAGGAQMIYLVFFSYAFFWEGWTGLTVVLGGIATLFVIMQLTGRIDWDEIFPDLARSRRDPAAVGSPVTLGT